MMFQMKSVIDKPTPINADAKSNLTEHISHESECPRGCVVTSSHSRECIVVHCASLCTFPSPRVLEAIS